MILYRFRLHRNDLTAENTEDTEGENRDLNHSDATGFDITRKKLQKTRFLEETGFLSIRSPSSKLTITSR